MSKFKQSSKFESTKTLGWIRTQALNQTDKYFNFQSPTYEKWKLKGRNTKLA